MTTAPARRAARLAGAWVLESWEVFRNGELDTYPHGPDGQGRLVLSSNGQLSAFLQRASWAGTEAGMKVAWDRFIAFGGIWRLEDDRLVFDVAYASESRWIGKTMVRPAKIEKKKLIYETPPVTNRKDESLVNRLIWRKFE